MLRARLSVQDHIAQFGKRTFSVDYLEEGGFLRPILGSLVFLIVFSLLISAIDLFPNRVMKIYQSEEVVRYHIKKVSRIPREKEKEEKEKVAIEEETLSREEIIERYYHYVVDRIEMNKVYPPEEQYKGHEGTVLLKMIISRSGAIEKVTILQQPRYVKLTGAAIDAIRNALPFKPYSRLIQDDRLVLSLEINFSLQ